MTERRKSNQSRGPVWLPLALIGAGVVLLLTNFLFITDFNVALLIPILLVLPALQILLRGDFIPDTGTRPYGIRRGNAEAATLDINAGEVDVVINAFQELQQERLIAGQYASNTLPAMQVDDIRVHLTMNRWQTPWLSFADWEMGLSRDLPWTIGISSFLGQVDADLSGMVLKEAVISTGSGDIRLVAPSELFEAIEVRSTLGNIHIMTPPGIASRIYVQERRFFTVNVSEHRYQQDDTQITDNATDTCYIARDAAPDSQPVNIYLYGRYGNAYLT